MAKRRRRRRVSEHDDGCKTAGRSAAVRGRLRDHHAMTLRRGAQSRSRGSRDVPSQVVAGGYRAASLCSRLCDHVVHAQGETNSHARRRSPGQMTTSSSLFDFSIYPSPQDAAAITQSRTLCLRYLVATPSPSPYHQALLLSLGRLAACLDFDPRRVRLPACRSSISERLRPPETIINFSSSALSPTTSLIPRRRFLTLDSSYWPTPHPSSPHRASSCILARVTPQWHQHADIMVRE